ncbi:MAG: GNAT family N-acetyltransferase [Phycisphaerae bacterium]|nr:GNAT family N-acetyltransferase [Phycisphaerae bacterium]
MSALGTLNIGIVGACGRGKSFKSACDALDMVRVHAVCDTYVEGLDEAAARLGAAEKYADFETMLEKSELDAVIIGTPMQFHVPQAIAALQRNVHVLSEVPAGVSIDECRQLVAACQVSKAVYMMAENYTYTRPNVLVREMARRGLFGQPYYAEGEYIHELKELNEKTVWRRKWQTGIDGLTYPTHSLGPILQWMHGDRVVSVSCAGSGHHHRDPRGHEYENEDSVVALCRMRSGGLVKIRVDMLSDRPHAMTNYQLQGTDGCYESARAKGEANRVWLKSRNGGKDAWTDLKELEGEFLPEFWRTHFERASKAGHGGGDYFEVLDFVDAILGTRPAPVGIHEAMDMTLPGLISQQSILAESRWMDVPDSRTWIGERALGQLNMVWPEDRLDRPPAVRLPAGYAMRQYQPGDEAGYVDLMHKVQLGGPWDHAKIEQWQSHILPGGFFVVVHQPTGKLVATSMATHRPRPLHPGGGEVGWIAADPDHKGKGLGVAVTAAAVSRLIAAGYRRIYLLTDDFRMPAVKAYLNVGLVPLMYSDDMPGRWQTLCKELGWTGA